jgi:ParB family chromosome partitioning protein
MAKRRKLETPSAEDMSKLAAEIDGEGAKAKPAPISQIAAEAAGGLDPRPTGDRTASAELARAEAQGLLIREVALDDIDPEALVRDRVVLDAGELEELRASIERNGLRLPIEIFANAEGSARPFALLSGYRRYVAVRQLHEATGEAKWASIKAIVRAPETLGGPFVAMVEENEIRAQLSHYERGRIAVVAAGQGVFVNTEAAVNALFPVASKAKRSKIRSFAVIFEELGDVLHYPDLITEKLGLRIATAIREGHDEALRDKLVGAFIDTPEKETALLNRALEGLGPELDAPRKSGRPRKVPDAVTWSGGGMALSAARKGRVTTIRIEGAELENPALEALLAQIERLLTER